MHRTTVASKLDARRPREHKQQFKLDFIAVDYIRTGHLPWCTEVGRVTNVAEI